LLLVAAAVRVRTPKREAVDSWWEKPQRVGALRVLLAARNQPAMHLLLVVAEQPMLAVAEAVIGVVEEVPHTAVAVVGLRTSMQVYLAWCTRRHIHLQQAMDH
jgi:hypothetical protein